MLVDTGRRWSEARRAGAELTTGHVETLVEDAGKAVPVVAPDELDPAEAAAIVGLRLWVATWVRRSSRLKLASRSGECRS